MPAAPPAATPLSAALSAALPSHAYPALPATPPLQLSHLELLHNYSTLASLTLSTNPDLRNVWRINVVREGLRHEFVMRSIFAFSALHMASYAAVPADKARYLQMARAEHGVALRDIATALSRASADNCSALYSAALLTFLYAWAYPRQPGDIFLVSSPEPPRGQASSPGNGRASVADWVFLLRGLRSITEAWPDELLRGPVGPILRIGSESVGGSVRGNERVQSPAWLATPEHAQLACLHRLVAKLAGDDLPVYALSLENLERSFCYSSSHGGADDLSLPGTSAGPAGPGQMSSVYFWLYAMEDEFIDLIVQRRPLALVVFAHFCVLLRLLSSCWWMDGWTTHLMQEIWDLLDEDHRPRIQWPIEELGWRPGRGG